MEAQQRITWLLRRTRNTSGIGLEKADFFASLCGVWPDRRIRGYAHQECPPQILREIQTRDFDDVRSPG